MAGHSKFKNIMHRKGRQDAKRAKVFAKLGKELSVAARGGTDPDFNPRLRLAIAAAKAQNMPNDNIQRSIKRAEGDDSVIYEEVRYEGYGPGGVAVIVWSSTFFQPPATTCSPPNSTAVTPSNQRPVRVTGDRSCTGPCAGVTRPTCGA